MSLDDRTARALLSGLAEPGEPAVVAAVAREGAAAVVDAVVAGDPALAGAPALASRLSPAPAEQAAADLARIAELGGAFLVPGDPGWPTQLDDLGPRRPLGVWVLGGADLRWAALRSVSVVGARAATSYGVGVAAELAAGLAERGWSVVSGGAYGVDAAAHRGALAVEGVTVAVLAGGVDVPYPRAHDALLARVLDAGVVVSEVPPGSAPMRWRFLVRNRVIAALSRGTVVVEAAVRSGALATARDAGALDRQVMGVPGPVSSAMSQGVHGLLRDGAALVTSAADVIELVGAIGDDLAAPGLAPPQPRDALPAETRRVLDALPVRRPVGADSVARVAGLAITTVIAALAVLELEGLAERTVDGWRVRRPPV